MVSTSFPRPARLNGGTVLKIALALAVVSALLRVLGVWRTSAILKRAIRPRPDASPAVDPRRRAKAGPRPDKRYLQLPAPPGSVASKSMNCSIAEEYLAHSSNHCCPVKENLQSRNPLHTNALRD